jgi:pilus assembly protein CpaF
MRSRLFDLVLKHDEIADLSVAERRLALRAIVAEQEDISDVAAAVERLADDIDGYGPLSRLMEDDAVTDILVNGPDAVWAERSGVLERTKVRFTDRDEITSLVDRMLARTGMRADLSSPIADARLADGSRLHVVLPPLAPEGPLISIRRFASRPMTMDDLVGAGMLDAEDAALLLSAVTGRRSIAVSGATGTGKTTFVNALLAAIGPAERVIVMEETPELQPVSPHVVSLLTRPPNVEGRGGVTLEDLVRAALRMRPDRIVIGEVRGPEALAALSAMSTGHPGSMITVHARSARDVIARMTSLALQAGSGATEASLADRAHDALEVIVHLERRGPRRVVSEICM